MMDPESSTSAEQPGGTVELVGTCKTEHGHIGTRVSNALGERGGEVR